MTNLVARKVFGDYGLGIWNKSFYRYSGLYHEVTELQAVDDLRNALHRLKISSVHLTDVLKSLDLRGF